MRKKTLVWVIFKSRRDNCFKVKTKNDLTFLANNNSKWRREGSLDVVSQVFAIETENDKVKQKLTFESWTVKVYLKDKFFKT